MDIAAGTHSLSIATADASALRTRAVQKLAQRLMTELASERAPVVARMQTLSGAAQRQAMNDLHTAETPRLAEAPHVDGRGAEPLAASRQDRAGRRARAIQLEAVFRAESHLGDVTQAHHDAAQACGMSITDDWCGFFVATAFMQSDLDSDLRGGFFHVENVVDYFRYDGRVNLCGSTKRSGVTAPCGEHPRLPRGTRLAAAAGRRRRDPGGGCVVDIGRGTSR